MKNKYRRNPIVLSSLIVTSIDVIGMLWATVTEHNTWQDIELIGAALFLLSPFAYFGYKLWSTGETPYSRLLSVYLLLFGLLYLLTAAVVGEGSFAIFGVLHILIAISLLFYKGSIKQESETD